MSQAFDLERYIQQYQRFLRTLKPIAYAPAPYRYHLAGYAARYLNPQQAGFPENFKKAIDSTLPELDSEAVWQRYLHHIGANHLNVFRFANMGKDWLAKHVEIHDHANLAEKFKQGRGIFMMTYHHHYHFLFAACIGMMGYPIHPIGNHPKRNPVYKPEYPLIYDYINQYYKDSQAHFAGGDFCFVDEPASRQDLRNIINVLKKGRVLLSLNDIADSEGSHSQTVNLFGQTKHWSSGDVKLALRQKSPIIVGAIRWVARERFILELFSIEAETTAEVMQQYQQHLEHFIHADPAIWEAWSANFAT